MENFSRVSIGGTVKNLQDTEARRVLQASDRLYPGADLSVKFAAEIVAYPTVWDWIKSRTQSANFVDLHVGDYIPFVAGGNTIKAEIAGIDTYYKYGDAAVGHHIDFISRDCWPETHVFNKANYNNGTSVSAHPWLASDLYAWLNSLAMQVPNGTTADPALVAVDYTVSGIFNKLPTALKNVIVPKRALLPIRHTAGALLIDDNSWAWENAGKLWIPSEVEVYGCTHWGSRNGFASGGFQQYPLFAGNMKRIKGAGNEGAAASGGCFLLTAATPATLRLSAATAMPPRTLTSAPLCASASPKLEISRPLVGRDTKPQRQKEAQNL